MTHKYEAFGFIIESPYKILQVEEIYTDQKPDIVIKEADLAELNQIPDYEEVVEEDTISLNYPRAGRFCISKGCQIEVDLNDCCTDEILSIYLMGSCMGAIFHQRKLLPIHGSCVTDGNHSVIISGDSGAGKSTLASEFLKMGWKLVTDDVSLVKNLDTNPVVQSSYPSQKLWQDSLANYQSENRPYQTLYKMTEREKFGVSVKQSFYKGTAPLSLFVQLFKAPEKTFIDEITGVGKIPRLVKNTYRSQFISPGNKNMYFQSCVTLSQYIPMIMAVREEGVPTAELLYTKITEFLKNANLG